ncbi:hypothetical protein BBK82_30900 [Lentzea guizhouensis]|uniref:VOC domain-containing protein n=1 Tax=Lentzea guizhouensis TaxID=1586287 RepID=A0A1B2HQ15_9PSEU|nr:VOC family protein [Lentzea guizhouensis]ANZ39795.1 hypothetical protein BBK82_30900 [Lentzea guizhouensis]
MSPHRGALAWFEIHVRDVTKAAEFYGTVFGWTFDPLGDADESLDGYLVITLANGEGAGGGLARTATPDEPAGRASSVLYLQVDDIPRTVELALSAGAAVHRPLMDIGGGHGLCAIIRDPDGNHVGLWSS